MYQVIARKYRPQTFDDVVNQDHVKRTLANALSKGRVAHGYIFSGQRGTGKTTMARIVAKALNCEKGASPTPCLQCSSCLEIAAGNSMDLLEIDAASNRRIDDIRELRENVRYRPARDRYKVFIIDEAHQITSDAFNALLKTLEEPPEWVVFMLCTTEAQQIPATIVSRCQSFQFRAVEIEKVVERMRWICEQEGIEADEDALITIALSGDGSIRDSLSTLDQAIASFGNRLETGPVRDLLGAIPSEITDEIVEALRSGNAAAMLALVDRITSEGRHVQHFCGELTRYFRNLLVLKVSGEDTRLVTLGPNERKRVISHLEHFSQEDLTRYLQLLLELYRELQHAAQPRFRLEVGLLKLVYAGHLQSIEKVLAGWGPGSQGEAAPSAGGAATGSGLSRRSASPAPDPLARPSATGQPVTSQTAPVQASSPTEPVAKGDNEAPPATVPSASPASTASAAMAAAGAGDLRTQLMRVLIDTGDEHLADAIEHGAVEQTEKQIEIRTLADYRTSLEMDMDTLTQSLRQIAGRDVRVTLGSNLQEGELDPSVAPATARKSAEGSGKNGETLGEAAGRALADPEVQKYQKLFEGQVREIRDLRGYSS
ncbi:MAG TPA: DNA polymerase III subunit gamma/tau [Burkholderiales bacterium]|nr:DNA polymerase III subunit gamma/tau [Burkholderiales bacterium]